MTGGSIFVILLFFAFFSTEVYAFSLSFLNTKRKTGRIYVTETETYRVLFATTGEKGTSKSKQGKRIKWRRVACKVVFLASKDNPLLKSPAAEVFLRDKKGFDLGRAQFSREYVNSGNEAYGMIWVQKKMIRKLDHAFVRPYHDQTLPVSPREVSQKKAEEEAAARKLAEANRQPAPTPKPPAFDPNIRYTNAMIETLLKELEEAVEE